MPSIPKILFCPRCDRAFLGATRVLAWGKIMAHIRKAHPEYLPMVED